MAEHFQYRDDWKTRVFTCSCGWTGTFEEGSTEYFEELKDSSCPRCDTMLAIVSYNVTITKKPTTPPVVAEAAPSPSKPNLSDLSPSRLQAIRANLSAGWVLEQQLLAELAEEQAAREPAYLAELADVRRGLPPLPRKRRTRKRRR
ncbi:MAG: hypothetical protein ACT4PN_18270 [Nitrospiraceae bacterium]